MCKKMFLLASFTVLLVSAPSLFAGMGPIGPFEDVIGIGTQGPGGTGIHGMSLVTPLPDVWKDGKLVSQYVFTAGGDEIEDDGKNVGFDKGFSYAYRMMSGAYRVQADFDGWLAIDEAGGYGLMLRETSDADSVHNYSWSTRNGEKGTYLLWRETTGGQDFESKLDEQGPKTMWNLAIDHVPYGGSVFIRAQRNNGAGWQTMGQRWVADADLADNLMAGVAAYSKYDRDTPDLPPEELANSQMAQMLMSDIQYTLDPWANIPKEGKLDEECEGCGDVRGFYGTAIYADTAGGSPDLDAGTYFEEFENILTLINTGELGGVAGIVGADPRRIDLANLHDTGGRGLFNKTDNAYEDQSFPGIDPFEQETLDPAAGDDDEHFVVELTGCIELTEGLHVIGAEAIDKVMVEIDGVEIGRTFDDGDIADFPFFVEEAGQYAFRAIIGSGKGHARAELYEILADGTRILLNDPAYDAQGASPVYAIPEPATMMLLGLGSLALLRIRKRR